MPSPHAVVIALEDSLLATSLAAALSASFRVIGPVDSLMVLEAELSRCRVCAAVVDVTLAGHSVLAVLERLAVRFPATRFVVCTHPLAPPVAEAARLVGAVAVLDHGRSLTGITSGLRRLCAGEPWASAAGDGLPLASRRLAPNAVLSHREEQTLRLLQSGRSYREIAHALRVEVKTIERFVGALRQKYGLPKAQRVDWKELVERPGNE